jgi:hypothetical protein
VILRCFEVFLSVLRCFEVFFWVFFWGVFLRVKSVPGRHNFLQFFFLPHQFFYFKYIKK